jgi:hypothetical protein
MLTRFRSDFVNFITKSDAKKCRPICRHTALEPIEAAGPLGQSQQDVKLGPTALNRQDRYVYRLGSVILEAIN